MSYRKSTHSGPSACVEVDDSGWHKFSRSNQGNCLEFRKSSHSGRSGCVEVAKDERVLVRDSKFLTTDVLSFTPAAWRSFLDTLR